MKDFFLKCAVAIRAAVVYGLAVKRHGLQETNRKNDALIVQATFWHPLLLELIEEKKQAAIEGDITALALAETRLRLAVRRWEQEVATPLLNLHK